MKSLDEIQKARTWIKEAEAIIVGIGSGLTAAGGICYTDSELTQKWYPEYSAMGKKSIIEIMSNFWPNNVNEKNATAFWGFWARHIWHIRYESAVLQPYSDLFSLISEKDYFIVSTNVDGQLEKAGFPKSQIFAPQGDYALFQCSKPCCNEVWYNHETVIKMIGNMENQFEIRREDIPKCPKCNAYLLPNLRCDSSFVEKPHIKNMNDYEGFIVSRQDKRLIFLELGVGFNTPVIIRFPFEEMTSILPNASLIRINRDDIRTTFDVRDKGIYIKDDLTKILHGITKLSA